MFGGHAGQSIAGHAGEVALKLRVSGGDFVEEGQPELGLMRRAFPSSERDLGRVVLAAVAPRLARAQVHDAARGVEKPGVGVPLLDGRGVCAVGLREPFYGGDDACGGNLGRDLLVETFGGGATADEAGKIEGLEGGFLEPQFPSPGKPMAPGRDVFPVSAMLVCEIQGQGVFRKTGRRFLFFLRPSRHAGDLFRSRQIVERVRFLWLGPGRCSILRVAGDARRNAFHLVIRQGRVTAVGIDGLQSHGDFIFLQALAPHGARDTGQFLIARAICDRGSYWSRRGLAALAEGVPELGQDFLG